MTPQSTTDHLILLSFDEDGRITSACATRTLRDLHATEADLRRHLGRPRRRPDNTNRGGAQAA